MGVIADNLVLGLDEIKQYLRVDDELETTLMLATAADGYDYTLSSVVGLKANHYVTIGGFDAKITYISYGERLIVLDRLISDRPMGEGTPVTYHFQNNMFITLAEAAKSQLDRYLDNDFTYYVTSILDNSLIPIVRIPEEVKFWVLGKIARDYVIPEVGLISRSQSEQGHVRFGDDIYDSVNHLRRIVVG